MKIEQPDTIRHLQGDRVLVTADKAEYLFSFVHFVENKHHELRLRNETDRRVDRLPVTQAILDNLTPIKHETAKWKLAL